MKKIKTKRNSVNLRGTLINKDNKSITIRIEHNEHQEEFSLRLSESIKNNSEDTLDDLRVGDMVATESCLTSEAIPDSQEKKVVIILHRIEKYVEKRCGL